MTLGEHLKTLRENKGLALRQLAAMLELDQSTLSKYENGHRLPTKEQIIKIAKIYKVKEKELLTLYYAEQLSTIIINSGLDKSILKVAEDQVEYKKAQIKEGKKK